MTNTRRSSREKQDSGRGVGKSRRTVLSDVQAGFDRLVEQGDNSQRTATAKAVRIGQLIAKFGVDADRTTWDLRKMFRGGAASFLRKLEDAYPNAGTRATLLGIVISMLDVMGSMTLGVSGVGYDAIYNAMTRMAGERDAIRAENPTDENADYMSWAALRGVLQTLGEKDFGSEAHFVLALVTLLPPRRSEYATCKWADAVPPASANGNYIVVPEDGPCSVHISKYKTAGTYGTFRLEINKENKFIEDADLLNRIIRAWKERPSRKRNPQGLVLPNAAGKVDDGRFQRIIKTSIKSVAGKMIGIRQIRRIYATHLSMGPPMSTADKQTVAHMMGHGLEQSDTYRIIDEVNRQYEATRDDMERSDRQIDELESIVSELQESIPQLQAESARYLQALRDIIKVAQDALQ